MDRNIIRGMDDMYCSNAHMLYVIHYMRTVLIYLVLYIWYEFHHKLPQYVFAF